MQVSMELASNRHHFIFLGLDDFIDAPDEIIGDLLHPFLAMLGVIGVDFLFSRNP